MNSNTAAALDYGIFRRKDFNETAQNILFYDMGASSTVATVASYQVVKTKEKGYAEYHPQVSVTGLGYVIKTLLMGVVVLCCAKFLKGVFVDNFITAVGVAFLVAMVNATLGTLLRVLTFPITLLTLGFSSLLISVLIIYSVDYYLVGFNIEGFFTYAKFGFILSVARMFMGILLKD